MRIVGLMYQVRSMRRIEALPLSIFPKIFKRCQCTWARAQRNLF